MKSQILKTAALAATIVAAGSANAIMIDNFDAVAPPLPQSVPIVNLNIGPSSGGFGRTLNAASTNAGNITIDINGTNTAGHYSHSNDAGSTGFSQLDFDLNGGGGSFDLTADGADRFRLELTNLDIVAGGSLLSIIIEDANAVVGTVSDSAFNIILAAGGLPSNYDVLFSDAGFAGIDFTMIDTVSFRFDGGPSADAEIDNFSTVPVPMPLPFTALMVGLGLAGLALRRKA